MTKENTLTSEVVEYIRGLKFETINDQVRTELYRCLVDGFAVMLSGSKAQCSRIILEYIDCLGLMVLHH